MALVHSARLRQQANQPLPLPIFWRAESSNALENGSGMFALGHFLHPIEELQQ